ncbi:MAG: CBS domain-containing protein [Lachnospiraceae bacterium]|nr:CBS domain-containing protein [Lachnospiraceae bacterium]
MDNNQKFTGKASLLVSEAMQLIDNNENGILFIVDNSNKLLGCITDGDIRRFLLAGGNMDAPAMDAANHFPKYAKSIDEARLLYHKKII